jgi:4-deoxy-L-threo-5-hexosulose-uronate ketol-isomerase
VDRVIFGGASPPIPGPGWKAARSFGTPNFLDRRELGVINIGGPAGSWSTAKPIELAKGDGLYVGMGTASVGFESEDPAQPAKFYLMSCPAHAAHPTVKITRATANPRRSSARPNPATCAPSTSTSTRPCARAASWSWADRARAGLVWNTYPPHTHERRMEVYLYFDMAEATRVFHMHGQPAETRHLVMANEQAVISPSWSIHSGVGTGPYSFIWGMAGENQTFDDMDVLGPDDLR